MKIFISNKWAFVVSLGIFVLLLPFIATIRFPDLMQISDFLNTFYVAGHMVSHGQIDQLYPSADVQSLTTAPFNNYFHQLLPAVPSKYITFFMYPPLTAYMFAWVDGMKPQIVMIIWQIVSTLAWILCSKLMSQAAGIPWGKCFWYSVLFFPIFQTILIGQSGIVLGLVPLSLGYWLLMRKRNMLAGLVWSLLLLKPQYLPVVLFVSFALTFIGKWRCFLGFLIGAFTLVLCMLSLPNPTIVCNWLSSLKLGEAAFLSPIYSYPSYLAASMPRAILQVLPIVLRDNAKYVIYPLASLIALYTFIRAIRFLKTDPSNYLKTLPTVFVLAISLLPLIVPHFLFYELSVLALAGIVIYGIDLLQPNRALVISTLFVWLVIDAYLVLFMFINPKLAHPLVLVIILFLFYRRNLMACKS